MNVDELKIAAILTVGTVVLRVAYAAVSHLVQPYPRLRALVELIAAVSPDAIRAASQAVSLLTGRRAPKLDRDPWS